MMAERVGILGGSFDPIHLGHMIVAQDAWEQMNLDAVYFVPNGQTPLKGGLPAASDEQRLAMVHLAVEEHPHFKVLDCELKKGGMNYTIDTVRWLKTQWPEREIYWIIGADQVRQLLDWKAIAAIFDYTDFICLQRPGYPLECPPELPREKLHRVDGHAFDISSSELRQRVAECRGVSFFLSEKVENYIKSNSLYEK